jgi:hypothetical protein
MKHPRRQPSSYPPQKKRQISQGLKMFENTVLEKLVGPKTDEEKLSSKMTTFAFFTEYYCYSHIQRMSEKFFQTIVWENWREEADLDVNQRIILKWFLNKYGVTIWIQVAQNRIQRWGIVNKVINLSIS